MIANLPAPFAPLVTSGEGLDRYPAQPSALAARLADIYGVSVDHVLPVRGLTGNLPHRATHQVQVHLGVRAGRIDLVAADDQFAFRAQGHPGLV